jgi:hypothetical protein
MTNNIKHYDLLKIIHKMDSDILELQEKLTGMCYILGAARAALYLDDEREKHEAFYSATKTISEKRLDKILKKYEINC